VEEVDWPVAGSGAAGMTGAVVAHELGGSVLVVEKESAYGGTTTKSGGVAWIPGNHRQAELGIEDSTEEGFAYLRGLIGDSVPEARIRAYAERAQEMLRFMMQHSHIAYTPLPDYMDYYEQVPGYKPGGRSMDPAPFNLRRLGAEAANIRKDRYAILPFNVTVIEGRRLGEMDIAAYLQSHRQLLPENLALKQQLATLQQSVKRPCASVSDRNFPAWRPSYRGKGVKRISNREVRSPAEHHAAMAGFCSCKTGIHAFHGNNLGTTSCGAPLKRVFNIDKVN
jgi:3-oxosteroid 1-dehydrogenase